MRQVLAAAVLLAITACTGVDKTTSVQTPVGSLKSSGVPNVGALPDLIVDAKATQNNWVVRVEDLPADFCSVEEGNITPGEHTLLRFTVTTPNIGAGDVFVGSPLKHMDPNGDGNFADSDGLFEFATCHKHFHFQHYATYKLIGPDGHVWKAAKRGFCMLDTDPNPASLGYGSPGPGKYHNCGAVGIPGNQGVTAGWADTYRFYLAGQFFVLDGGDGQDPVPPGDYVIRITANPPYKANKDNPCRALDPATGLCHNFAESDYTNNIGEVLITIPDHPGRSGFGPLAGASMPNKEPAEH